MNDVQKSEQHSCPGCSSITTVFNPPLEIDITQVIEEDCQPCEKMHPEIGVKCHLYDCHDGEHAHFMKDPITWKD